MTQATMGRRVNKSHRTAGQTLVLGCVTLLIMALMLALSFNLTNAIHEKMRLQTHSDVMAYSTAVMEARSFNYFAYTNRASAALLVAQTTIHAYMSSISMIPSILSAGKTNFIVIAIEEIALCCTCGPPLVCCQVQHCKDAVEAFKISNKYSDEASDAADKVGGLDSKFNSSVEALQNAVGTINKEQQDAVSKMEKVLNTGEGLGALKTTNAQYATDVNSQIGRMNRDNYACALEGTDLDSKCTRSPSASDQEARARVMTDVANGSRPDFPVKRPPAVPLQLDQQWQKSKYSDIQGNEGTSVPDPYFGGSAGLTESGCDIASLNKGTNICGEDSGMFISTWRHGGMTSSYNSKIDSGDSPAHDPSSAHQQEHDKFKGVQNKDGSACMKTGNCFINFRSNVEDQDDWEKPSYNQPTVYAAHTQDLRKRVSGGSTPWELNKAGKVEITGDHGGGILNLVPKRDGNAISKAKVYFHRFDEWQFPPNMFDPYWRAKLHPFTKTEAANVAKVIDSDAEDAAKVIVEGDGL